MRHHGSAIVLMAAVLSIVISGCTYKASFSPYVKESAFNELTQGRAKLPPGDIDTYFLGVSAPKRSYIVLGVMEAPTVQWTAHYTRDDLIKAIKNKASEIGADAVMNLRDVQNPGVAGSISPVTGGTAVTFKNLYMWGDAILFVSEAQKQHYEDTYVK